MTHWRFGCNDSEGWIFDLCFPPFLTGVSLTLHLIRRRCGAPFPKAISQKMLKIVCRFICFRVKCWFQPIDLGLGVHHFLLETSKWKYLIPCHTSYSRGVLKPETKLTTKLLTFCHCRNPSVLSPKTSCIFKSTHWHWCSINTVALWEGIISEPSWRSLEQL